MIGLVFQAICHPTEFYALLRYKFDPSLKVPKHQVNFLDFDFFFFKLFFSNNLKTQKKKKKGYFP